MKKKIVAIMMMAVLALSTAACGADGETTAVAHRQAIQGEACISVIIPVAEETGNVIPAVLYEHCPAGQKQYPSRHTV